MAVGIGASGIVGVAHETIAGTYVAPAQFTPVRNESLVYDFDINKTRPIRGVADPVFAVKGNAFVQGDIEFEVTEDQLVYWLYGARMDVVKAGADPYTYAFTPSHAAEAPNKTLSITVVRNGITFGYVGCIVGSIGFSVDNGLFIVTLGILGEDEASETLPTATWPTETPFGADLYTIEIPTATGVTDVDDFSFDIDDSAEAAFRLGSLAATFIKFGERTVEASAERDFEARADYDNFKAATAESITFQVEKDATHYVYIVAPVVIKDSYEVSLDGQGDLVRGSIEWVGLHDNAGGSAFTIDIGTDLSIV